MNALTTQVVNIAVVDDSERDRKRIVDLLKSYEQKNGAKFILKEFIDGAEIIDNYQSDFDLIFLDIQMGGVDGMRTAMTIRRVDASVMIILVTKTAQYATKGYEVQAQNYILKPVTSFAFESELERSLSQLQRKEKSSILVGSKIAPRRLELSEILFIESQKHKITVRTFDEHIVFTGTLKDYENTLKGHNYYRSNSGYLINLQHVMAIDGEDCIMSNGERLKVSRSRKKGLLDSLAEYIGGRLR